MAARTRSSTKLSRSPREAAEPRRRRRTLRLSPDVRPQTIDLHFEVDPESARFRGQARYALVLDRRKRQIELHCADLQISAVRVSFRRELGDEFGAEVVSGRAELHPECETVVLRFDRLLPAQPLRLELEFRGRVRADLRGLYRSSDRESPWLATQLCPTDARRVFPCFDEPGIKARYRIEITAPRDQTVLSNSPVADEEDLADGRKRVRFERTPPLSAYLIAFAVGPFEASPVLMSGATAIRVYSLPGRQTLANFAREAAAESLQRLEAWFDLPHPYPKLDLVALPDFAFGAMENAGAVFFRDSVLLLDAAQASPAERKRTGETIAHELAHMWFGNLVTMAWWNDLWLNESFATWMAYEIIDAWQPDWRIWNDFAHRRESALEADALASSHPIAPPVKSAEEAHENFDAITYTKGACVLRMLERYLGHEVFREGIQLYIRRHREEAASASDLWAALEEVSNEKIESIVAPWTLQTGLPLVSLRRDERDGRGVIELRQQRFFAKAAPASGRRAARDATRWAIPWVGRVGRGGGDDAGDARAIRQLLKKAREWIPSHAAELTWIYGNAGEAGFFRIEHGASEFEDLLANRTSLAPPERIGLVGHQLALVQAGRRGVEDLLDLIAALGTDDDPDVLLAVESALETLLRRLASDPEAHAVDARLRAWITVYYGAQIDALGFRARATDDEHERLRRARIYSIVGGLGRAERVLRECTTRTRRHLETGDALPPELAREIVQIAASQGDARLQHALREAARRAATPQVRQRSLLALAAFPQPREIEAGLACVLDEALAPAPDRAALLMAFFARPSSAPLAWQFVQKNWRRLERGLPPILLARIVGTTARALPPAAADEVRHFFRLHPLAAGDRVLEQVAEEFAIARGFAAHAAGALERYLGSAESESESEVTLD